MKKEDFECFEGIWSNFDYEDSGVWTNVGFVEIQKSNIKLCLNIFGSVKCFEIFNDEIFNVLLIPIITRLIKDIDVELEVDDAVSETLNIINSFKIECERLRTTPWTNELLEKYINKELDPEAHFCAEFCSKYEYIYKLKK